MWTVGISPGFTGRRYEVHHWIDDSVNCNAATPFKCPPVQLCIFQEPWSMLTWSWNSRTDQRLLGVAYLFRCHHPVLHEFCWKPTELFMYPCPIFLEYPVEVRKNEQSFCLEKTNFDIKKQKASKAFLLRFSRRNLFQSSNEDFLNC